MNANLHIDNQIFGYFHANFSQFDIAVQSVALASSFQSKRKILHVSTKVIVLRDYFKRDWIKGL